MNGAQKTLPMRVSEEDLARYFEVMKDANYPVMIFGSPAQQAWMFTRMFAKNALYLLRNPDLIKLMIGKA